MYGSNGYDVIPEGVAVQYYPHVSTTDGLVEDVDVVDGGGTAVPGDDGLVLDPLPTGGGGGGDVPDGEPAPDPEDVGVVDD